MLIEMGADVNAVHEEHKNALHFLSENSCNMKTLEYLIRKKINVNERDNEGKTPLYYACANDKCSKEYIM